MHESITWKGICNQFHLQYTMRRGEYVLHSDDAIQEGTFLPLFTEKRFGLWQSHKNIDIFPDFRRKRGGEKLIRWVDVQKNS